MPQCRTTKNVTSLDECPVNEGLKLGDDSRWRRTSEGAIPGGRLLRVLQVNARNERVNIRTGNAAFEWRKAIGGPASRSEPEDLATS